MTLAALIPRLVARAVRQPNGCLLIVHPSKQRYWCVSFDGRRSRAHQAMWQFHHGTIERGICVCHSCDNPRCIEIDHLFLGTVADNMADRDSKGRNGTLGENSPLHKLTKEDVLGIYKCCLAGWEHHEIASNYTISIHTVRRIANRQTWRHLLTKLAA